MGTYPKSLRLGALAKRPRDASMLAEGQNWIPAETKLQEIFGFELTYGFGWFLHVLYLFWMGLLLMMDNEYMAAMI